MKNIIQMSFITEKLIAENNDLGIHLMVVAVGTIILAGALILLAYNGHLIRQIRRMKKDLTVSKSSIYATLSHADLRFWEYYPQGDYAIQTEQTQEKFHVPEVMTNYPESWIALGAVHPDYIGDFRHLHEKIKEGATNAECEILVKNGVDEYSWERIKYSAISDENNEFAKVVGTAEKIDEYKNLEKRFAIATEQMGFLTWVYDIENRKIVKETEFTSVYGAKGKIGKKYGLEVVHPDDRHIVNRMFKRLQSGEKNVSAEFRYHITTHDYRWIKVVYTTIMNESGRMVRAVGSATDITTYKNAENKYYTQMSLFSALNPNTIGTIHVNLTKNWCGEGKSIYPSILHLLRIQNADEFFEEVCNNVSYSHERERAKGLFNRQRFLDEFKEGKTNFSFEHKYCLSDTRESWVTCYVNMMQNPESGDVEALIHAVDTQNKKLLEEVLQSVTHTDYDFIFLIDGKYNSAKIISKNENFNMKYGTVFDNYERTVREYIGSEMIEEDKKILIQNSQLSIIEAYLLQKPVYTMYYSLKKSGGSVLRKKVSYFYIEKENQYICCTRTDITDIFEEQQRKNEELGRALNLAERASKAKSDFLSNMSHDIRTPMNAIVGLTEIAIDKVQDNDARTYFEKIKTSAKFLLGLVNDILDMAKMESTRLELHVEDVNVAEFIRNVLTVTQPQVEKKHIHFTHQSSGLENRILIFDRMRVQQIMQNVLSNAVKFTKEEGNIVFSVSCSEISDTQAQLKIRVQDDGIGMTKAFQKKMFKAFEQEYDATITQYAGTGLGLTIVKNLVDMMRGTITLESDKNAGTLVEVLLEFPISVRKQERMRALDMESIDFVGKKVLLVEDNEINAEIATMLLEDRGFQIVHAKNGREGVDTFKSSGEYNFDVIMMDIQMPVLNGLEATREIRAMEGTYAKTIPIVAMTANAFTEDEKKSLESGMNRHLSKPIDTLELFTTLGELLAKK